MRVRDSAEDALADEHVREAINRGFIEIKASRIIYGLSPKKDYDWLDPEEWCRARTFAFLVIARGYPANRIRMEVSVPRRTPNDYADIVVYRDDRCREPYLVVENKSANQSEKSRRQWIEQAFGNSNSLRAPYALYDEFSESIFYDVANYPPTERKANRRGTREAIPAQYGDVPDFEHIAGQEGDIAPMRPSMIEARIRRAHSIIWAGGKRDPLVAFDEWSKLLFAKVIDERFTPTGEPRRFQVGSNETITTVANRIHVLFKQACEEDPTIFPDEIKIVLPDKKVYEVVEALQDISFIATDVDSLGIAFENFFGSVFRGKLGQYFTMRQLARFIVALLDIDHTHFVLDPAAGSGGFLLEALLQVWHSIERRFHGQAPERIDRIKTDFALTKVYGIEIHEILGRICKINLLLHHDGHTNIEADRSCLDSVFTKPRLGEARGRFHRVVGNPPFGDEVQEGDEDRLGSNTLETFDIAAGRGAVASEHVILERSIKFLDGGGRLGLVVPDGMLNNQGAPSNCPQVRHLMARFGFIEAIVSLPDYAFRKSGAQNKTSILFFRRFTNAEQRTFDRAYQAAIAAGQSTSEAIATMWSASRHHVFLAEANHVGYAPTGAPSPNNDLYRGEKGGQLAADQTGSILGEYRRFIADPAGYDGHTSPDCMSIEFSELWSAHSSNRLDPKYFLFKRDEHSELPPGWIRLPVSEVMQRREQQVDPAASPDQPVSVMTIGQNGEIRPREAGKGRNPPEWLGMYFEDSPSRWFAAKAGDVVFSSIDLWKGCISIVPPDFDGALVTQEFPIYAVTDDRLDPEFVSYLLRSRYYQRAFRAITTGHSNRRRTQEQDFEALEISFPPDPEMQRTLIASMRSARENQRRAAENLRNEFFRFSDLIDRRGFEELPSIDPDGTDEDDASE